MGGDPSLMPSFEGNLLTQRHEICSQATRDVKLLYIMKTRGFYPTSAMFNWYRVAANRQTDGRTDGRTDERTVYDGFY